MSETQNGTKKSKKTQAKYAVTFEFQTRQPITIRGEVESFSLSSLFARAVREAHKINRKQFKNKEIKETTKGWTSISVLIDRYDFVKNISE